MALSINRLDVNVMKILAQEKCFDELCGMTINEINTFYGEDDLLTTRHNLVMRVKTLVIRRLTRKILFRLLVFQDELLKAMEVTRRFVQYLVYHFHSIP